MSPPKKKRPKRRPKFQRKELRLEELEAIVERARAALSAEDHQKLAAAMDTLGWLTRELEAKGASVRRLRAMMFGPSTEKTSQVVGENARTGPQESAEGAGAAASQKSRPKPKGHGRNPAERYRGAEKGTVAHESLTHGARCPECERGKVYRQKQPKVLVRVKGTAPLRATVTELERLRCNLCGQVFTAREPPGLGTKKYDETAASMIALFRYGCGLPFNRLEKLQGDLGIPLPATTQWDVVSGAAKPMVPAFDELVRLAAQGEVLHNDDTTMRILELGDQPEEEAASGQGPRKRTGVFTSGIVSTSAGQKIALFFTGRKHAGENLSDVLSRRATELSAPIQMCDALSRNTKGDFDTILANCSAHARRRFVEVVNSFPEECRYVLEALGEVYQKDAAAKAQGLSPEKRLGFHQLHSGPVMERLESWLREKVEQRAVEPNSGLGQAIGYMRKHWHELTLFLREPGAPLDNNICERALKKSIMHRKNSLFYKTEKGAHVGDLYMSLIHTAELCGADPFDYLVALQRHRAEVEAAPGEWMPWNYGATRDRLSGSTPLPD